MILSLLPKTSLFDIILPESNNIIYDIFYTCIKLLLTKILLKRDRVRERERERKKEKRWMFMAHMSFTLSLNVA